MAASRLDSHQLSLDFDALFAPRAVAPPAPTVPPATPGRDQRCIQLAGRPLHYRLRRARRRSIGFRIDDEGLTVSAPRWVTLREIEAAIAAKQRWIGTKLAQWDADCRRRRLPDMRFADGGAVHYLGEPLPLRLRADALRTMLVATAAHAELHVALPPTATEMQIRDAVQAWLQGEARRILGERLHALALRSARPFSGWTLSSARSQWGSCTHDGRIRLNWRLIHFALPVIDYVVAHELAHLHEMNHGTRFWQRVGELMPGFEEARTLIRGVDLPALAGS
jgi:predicted metal-dependent hydrolase